jgi:hypothetical protein
MKTHFILAVLLILCAVVWSKDGQDVAVLLVTNEMWDEGDVAVQDKLLSLGFDVQTGLDADVDSSWADGMNFVYISSTVSSGNVSNKFKNVPIPVMIMEPYALDNMGMTLDTDTTRYFQSTQRNMVILQEGHFLAAGLTGEVTVFDSLEIQSAQAFPGPEGVVIAEYTREDTDTNWIYGAIVAYEKGAILADTTVAVERRYFAGWNDKGAAYFTEDGWKLWQAAVDWCLYKDQTAVNKPSENNPSRFTLSQNYPNPFNASTTINYKLQQKSHVDLNIFDIQGRSIATLVDAVVNAGSYQVNFDAGRLPSGVYIIKLQANGLMQLKKMTLVK